MLSGLLPLATTDAQSGVNELQRGASLSWKFLSDNYVITGAITQSGTVGTGNPVLFRLQVLFNFGGSDAGADTNGDGTIDDADLLTVLFNFG